MEISRHSGLHLPAYVFLVADVQNVFSRHCGSYLPAQRQVATPLESRLREGGGCTLSSRRGGRVGGWGLESGTEEEEDLPAPSSLCTTWRDVAGRDQAPRWCVYKGPAQFEFGR